VSEFELRYKKNNDERLSKTPFGKEVS